MAQKIKELMARLQQPDVMMRIKNFLGTNKEITPERLTTAFGAFLSVAAEENPEILDCTTASIVTCLLDIASLGWVPTTIPELQKFTIASYWSEKTKTKRAKLILTRAGHLALVRRIPGVQAVQVDVVRENDVFEMENGTEPRITHKIAPRNRGEAIGAYAIARFTHGNSVFYYADIGEIDGHISKLAHMDAAMKQEGRKGRYDRTIANAREFKEQYLRRYVIRKLVRYIAHEMPVSMGYDASSGYYLSGPMHDTAKLEASKAIALPEPEPEPEPPPRRASFCDDIAVELGPEPEPEADIIEHMDDDVDTTIDYDDEDGLFQP